MSKNLPEIRVFSPDRVDMSEKTVFSWHAPKYDVPSTYFTNSDNHLRALSTENKISTLFIKKETAAGEFLEASHNANMVKWENTFNMRSYNLNNFPANTTSYKTAYRSQAVAMQRARLGFITGTAKSLDILRQNMQKFINQEIDDIIQKYVERFFKPGIENIKINNGESSVSEQHLQTVCRQILEEAKKMYQNTSTRGISPTDFVEMENNLSSEQKSVNSGFVKTLAKKRRDSETDSEISFVPVKPKKRKGRPPNIISGRSTPLKFRQEQARREGPKWDPNRITKDTQFIMGAKANKALGLGATRGRLYIKHPDIFKYSGDQEDKQWLYDHNLMPATGGKAYILLIEDIKDLAESDEYRNNPTLLIDEIIGFTVPESILVKMQKTMKEMRTDVHVKKKCKQTFNNPEFTLGMKLEDFTSDEKQSGTVSPTDELDLLNSEMHSSAPSPFSFGGGLDASPQQPDISPAPSDLSATFDPNLNSSFDVSSNP